MADPPRSPVPPPSEAPAADSADRRLLESLLDLLNDGVLVLSADNIILRVNAAAEAIFDPPAATPLIGSRLDDLPGTASLMILVQYIHETRLPKMDEILMPGVASFCQASGTPLPAPPGIAPDLLFILRDTSRLRQLEGACEEYINNVSHELKTPLTLIQGYAETLLEPDGMDDEFRTESLQTILHHARRIGRIVDDLLRLTWLRIESTSFSISRTLIEIPKLLEQVVITCRQWAEPAGVVLEVSAPDDLIWPLHDGLMETAIVNLVKNAIFYALEGPVAIRARELPNQILEISVADRGVGLHPEDVSRIFERFYRTDKGRSRATGGSGLGLPIVQQIAEAHHGRARVETEPGSGCNFILEIPRSVKPGT